MLSTFAEYITLILIILALVMLANKLKVAYPIVLVIGGLLLSFTALFPNVSIHPEFIFFIFLPPLLYEAAWQVSWKQFHKFRRVIMSFAFPVVILTSSVVAFAANALIPGFTLALGFLLGGIVSPPDAVSASTIMRQVKVPKNLLTILEGESLLNDASSLIVFRFALVAILTGQFIFQEAAVNFVLVIFLGAGIGLAVGYIFYAIHKWLPTTPGIEIILTLVTPYCMYYAAEYFHYSGVLAVVCGGLLLSSKRNSMLSYESRMQGVNVWSNFVFVLNGLIFFLIGLQLPSITSQLGDTSLSTAIWYGLAISGVLIITRILCAYGAVVVTRIMSRFIKVADANPGYRGPLLLGWAGMRGVVSLAAALSIPLLTESGEAFPYRNLILFITFIVILVTLVGQGLTLPWLIRKLNLPDRNAIPAEKQELIIQKKMSLISRNHLHEHHAEKLSDKHLENLVARLELDVMRFEEAIAKSETTHTNPLAEFGAVYLEVLEAQRKLLNEMNRKMEFDEELIRKYLSLIDLEEHKIREKMQS
jgi:Na+/H+ antiporter